MWKMNGFFIYISLSPSAFNTGFPHTGDNFISPVAAGSLTSLTVRVKATMANNKLQGHWKQAAVTPTPALILKIHIRTKLGYFSPLLPLQVSSTTVFQLAI